MPAGFLRPGLVPMVLALALMALPAAAAPDIGAAAAVKNDVRGGSGPLSVGSRVFQNEVITTGAESLAQLMFLDETTLSLGPGSQITLDTFVFDPSQGAGSVVFSATKGAFRFITGSQNPRRYTINTPVATIGVRGTIVDCFIVSTGLVCIVEEGSATIGGHTVAAGQAIFISNDGDVTGPMTPDGSFFAITGPVPWPLFGDLLPAGYEQFEGPDDLTIRTEEVDQHIVPTVEEPPVEEPPTMYPPPPPPPGLEDVLLPSQMPPEEECGEECYYIDG